MLIAELDGERKFALYAQKRKDFVYICPECKEEVVLKKGKVVTHHFSHRSGSDCSNGKGESKEHLRAKFLLYTWAVNSGMKCDLELPINTPLGKRRADIYVEHEGKKYALEIQKSPIEFDAIEKRTESYRSVSIHPIWIPVLPKNKNLSSWQLWPILAHNSRCWFWEPNEEGLWLPNMTMYTRMGAPLIDWMGIHKETRCYRLDQLSLKPEYCKSLSTKINKPHKPSKKKIEIDLIEGVMGGFYLKDSGCNFWIPQKHDNFEKDKLVSIHSLTFKIQWYSKKESYLLFSWDTPHIEIFRLWSAAKEISDKVCIVLKGEEIRPIKFILFKKIGEGNIITL